MSDACDTIEDALIDALLAGGKGLRVVRPAVEVESSVMTLDDVDEEVGPNDKLVFTAVKAFVIEEVNGH